MSNSKKDKYKLEITPNQQNDWLSISVFDSNNQLMSKQMGGFAEDLPKGLYTVVSELSGSTTERIIKHTAKTVLPMDMPQIQIPKRVIDYIQIAREQRAYNKITYVNQEIPDSNGNTALLFVFCHNSVDNKNSKIAEMAEYLSVYDSMNRRVLEMDKSDWEINHEHGWMAFQAKMTPGMYFFNYKKGLKNRSFSIAISARYQTQIVFPVGKNAELDGIQLNLLHEGALGGSSDERENRSIQSYSIAKNKLMNSDFNVSEQVIRDLAEGKWEHPMYGFMVAYIYVLSGKSNQDSLFETILNNMKNHIVAHQDNPDLTILSLLYLMRKEPDKVTSWIKKNPINQVPMFRVGVDKLIELSYKYPGLIPENGMIDLISGRLYYATIWTCFKPTRMEYDFEVKTTRKNNLNSRGLFAQIKNKAQDVANIADLLDDFLPTIIEIQREKEWHVDSERLARSLGLPLVTFNRKINELNRIINENELAIKAIMIYLEKFFNKEFNQDKIIKYIRDLSDDKSEGKAFARR